MHKKIANQRKDFQFKLADAICKKYALICIEDLNIKGMQKCWGRKISDYGFSEFIKILEYKARKIGSIVQKIDRYYPSSQICHVCGTKNPETKNLAVVCCQFSVFPQFYKFCQQSVADNHNVVRKCQIGRASCRERV